MTIFTWIVLGLAAVFLLVSAVSWVLYLVLGDGDWRKLGVKSFRLSMVPVLLYINVVIYKHIISNVM